MPVRQCGLLEETNQMPVRPAVSHDLQSRHPAVGQRKKMADWTPWHLGVGERFNFPVMDGSTVLDLRQHIERQA